MDSPSPPQSLQNAEKAVDPVNNEKNGSVNIMSSDAVVVTIDLEKYEQKKECLLVEIKSLCQQLWSNAALNNQIKVFKRIEIQYSSDIDEEALWTYIFRQYIRVIRKCSNLKDDIRYQMHAVSMLAKYTNFQCSKLITFGHRRDQSKVFAVRDNILQLMDSLLSKCLTQKVMVMLKTNMVPKNAFLLLQLGEQLRDEIFQTLREPNKVSISLLNAALLVFNLWRHLMHHPKDVKNFYNSTESALDQLEARRTSLLLDKENREENCLFYNKFSKNFKTMSTRDLCALPVKKHVIDKFIKAHIALTSLEECRIVSWPHSTVPVNVPEAIVSTLNKEDSITLPASISHTLSCNLPNNISHTDSDQSSSSNCSNNTESQLNSTNSDNTLTNVGRIALVNISKLTTGDAVAMDTKNSIAGRECRLELNQQFDDKVVVSDVIPFPSIAVKSVQPDTFYLPVSVELPPNSESLISDNVILPRNAEVVEVIGGDQNGDKDIELIVIDETGDIGENVPVEAQISQPGDVVMHSKKPVLTTPHPKRINSILRRTGKPKSSAVSSKPLLLANHVPSKKIETVAAKSSTQTIPTAGPTEGCNPTVNEKPSNETPTVRENRSNETQSPEIPAFGILSTTPPIVGNTSIPTISTRITTIVPTENSGKIKIQITEISSTTNPDSQNTVAPLCMGTYCVGAPPLLVSGEADSSADINKSSDTRSDNVLGPQICDNANMSEPSLADEDVVNTIEVLTTEVIVENLNKTAANVVAAVDDKSSDLLNSAVECCLKPNTEQTDCTKDLEINNFNIQNVPVSECLQMEDHNINNSKETKNVIALEPIKEAVNISAENKILPSVDILCSQARISPTQCNENSTMFKDGTSISLNIASKNESQTDKIIIIANSKPVDICGVSNKSSIVAADDELEDISTDEECFNENEEENHSRSNADIVPMDSKPKSAHQTVFASKISPVHSPGPRGFSSPTTLLPQHISHAPVPLMSLSVTMPVMTPKELQDRPQQHMFGVATIDPSEQADENTNGRETPLNDERGENTVDKDNTIVADLSVLRNVDSQQSVSSEKSIYNSKIKISSDERSKSSATNSTYTINYKEPLIVRSNSVSIKTLSDDTVKMDSNLSNKNQDNRILDVKSVVAELRQTKSARKGLQTPNLTKILNKNDKVKPTESIPKSHIEKIEVKPSFPQKFEKTLAPVCKEKNKIPVFCSEQSALQKSINIASDLNLCLKSKETNLNAESATTMKNTSHLSNAAKCSDDKDFTSNLCVNTSQTLFAKNPMKKLAPKIVGSNESIAVTASLEESKRKVCVDSETTEELLKSSAILQTKPLVSQFVSTKGSTKIKKTLPTSERVFCEKLPDVDPTSVETKLKPAQSKIEVSSSKLIISAEEVSSMLVESRMESVKKNISSLESKELERTSLSVGHWKPLNAEFEARNSIKSSVPLKLAFQDHKSTSAVRNDSQKDLNNKTIDFPKTHMVVSNKELSVVRLNSKSDEGPVRIDIDLPKSVTYDRCQAGPTEVPIIPNDSVKNSLNQLKSVTEERSVKVNDSIKSIGNMKSITDSTDKMKSSLDLIDPANISQAKRPIECPESISTDITAKDAVHLGDCVHSTHIKTVEEVKKSISSSNLKSKTLLENHILPNSINIEKTLEKIDDSEILIGSAESLNIPVDNSTSIESSKISKDLQDQPFQPVKHDQNLEGSIIQSIRSTNTASPASQMDSEERNKAVLIPKSPEPQVPSIQTLQNNSSPNSASSRLAKTFDAINSITKTKKKTLGSKTSVNHLANSTGISSFVSNIPRETHTLVQETITVPSIALDQKINSCESVGSSTDSIKITAKATDESYSSSKSTREERECKANLSTFAFEQSLDAASQMVKLSLQPIDRDILGSKPTQSEPVNTSIDESLLQAAANELKNFPSNNPSNFMKSVVGGRRNSTTDNLSRVTRNASVKRRRNSIAEVEVSSKRKCYRYGGVLTSEFRTSGDKETTFNGNTTTVVLRSNSAHELSEEIVLNLIKCSDIDLKPILVKSSLGIKSNTVPDGIAKRKNVVKFILPNDSRQLSDKPSQTPSSASNVSPIEIVKISRNSIGENITNKLPTSNDKPEEFILPDYCSTVEQANVLKEQSGLTKPKKQISNQHNRQVFVKLNKLPAVNLPAKRTMDTSLMTDNIEPKRKSKRRDSIAVMVAQKAKKTATSICNKDAILPLSNIKTEDAFFGISDVGEVDDNRYSRKLRSTTLNNEILSNQMTDLHLRKASANERFINHVVCQADSTIKLEITKKISKEVGCTESISVQLPLVDPKLKKRCVVSLKRIVSPESNSMQINVKMNSKPDRRKSINASNKSQIDSCLSTKGFQVSTVSVQDKIDQEFQMKQLDLKPCVRSDVLKQSKIETHSISATPSTKVEFSANCIESNSNYLPKIINKSTSEETRDQDHRTDLKTSNVVTSPPLANTTDDDVLAKEKLHFLKAMQQNHYPSAKRRRSRSCESAKEKLHFLKAVQQTHYPGAKRWRSRSCESDSEKSANRMNWTHEISVYEKYTQQLPVAAEALPFDIHSLCNNSVRKESSLASLKIFDTVEVAFIKQCFRSFEIIDPSSVSYLDKLITKCQPAEISHDQLLNIETKFKLLKKTFINEDNKGTVQKSTATRLNDIIKISDKFLYNWNLIRCNIFGRNIKSTVTDLMTKHSEDTAATSLETITEEIEITSSENAILPPATDNNDKALENIITDKYVDLETILSKNRQDEEAAMSTSKANASNQDDYDLPKSPATLKITVPILSAESTDLLESLPAVEDFGENQTHIDITALLELKTTNEYDGTPEIEIDFGGILSQLDNESQLNHASIIKLSETVDSLGSNHTVFQSNTKHQDGLIGGYEVNSQPMVTLSSESNVDSKTLHDIEPSTSKVQPKVCVAPNAEYVAPNATDDDWKIYFNKETALTSSPTLMMPSVVKPLSAETSVAPAAIATVRKKRPESIAKPAASTAPTYTVVKHFSPLAKPTTPEKSTGIRSVIPGKLRAGNRKIVEDIKPNSVQQLKLDTIPVVVQSPKPANPIPGTSMPQKRKLFTTDIYEFVDDNDSPRKRTTVVHNRDSMNALPCLGAGIQQPVYNNPVRSTEEQPKLSKFGIYDKERNLSSIASPTTDASKSATSSGMIARRHSTCQATPAKLNNTTLRREKLPTNSVKIRRQSTEQHAVHPHAHSIQSKNPLVIQELPKHSNVRPQTMLPPASSRTQPVLPASCQSQIILAISSHSQTPSSRPQSILPQQAVVPPLNRPKTVQPPFNRTQTDQPPSNLSTSNRLQTVLPPSNQQHPVIPPPCRMQKFASIVQTPPQRPQSSSHPQIARPHPFPKSVGRTSQVHKPIALSMQPSLHKQQPIGRTPNHPAQSKYCATLDSHSSQPAGSSLHLTVDQRRLCHPIQELFPSPNSPNSINNSHIFGNQNRSLTEKPNPNQNPKDIFKYLENLKFMPN